MKRFLIALLALVAAASAAYYLLNRKSAASHESLIPDDTPALAVIDVVKMIKDSGVSIEVAKSRRMNVGIDFGRPVYAYMTKSGNIGVAAVLGNCNDLEPHLDDVRRNGGLTWGVLDGFLVCHDEDRVLLFGPDLTWDDKKAQEEMRELMDKQTTSSLLLQDLKAKEAPVRAKVSLAMAASVLDKDMASEIKGMLRKMYSDYAGADADIDIESLYLDLDGKATDNSIALTASLTSSDDKTNTVLTECKKKLRPITHELDVHIPQDATMWMCMNIDGKAVHSALIKNKDVAAQMEMIDRFINVSDILESLNGDVLSVLGDVSAKNMQFGLVAQADNTEFLTSQLKHTLEFFDIRVGEYEGRTNKSVYASNNPHMIQSMKTGGFQPDKEDGYDGDCVFFLTMDFGRLIPSVAKPYASISPETTALYEFFAQDVKTVSIRSTQDVVECRMVLKSAINDYVSKWIE